MLTKLKNFLLILNDYKLLWQKIRKFSIKFYHPTVCKECLRGRLWFMFFLGALIGSISIYLSIPALIMCGIHTGRKHNWWLKDD